MRYLILIILLLLGCISCSDDVPQFKVGDCYSYMGLYKVFKEGQYSYMVAKWDPDKTEWGVVSIQAKSDISDSYSRIDCPDWFLKEAKKKKKERRWE